MCWHSSVLYNYHKSPDRLERHTMKQHCYVIINNAGHSWMALTAGDAGTPKDPNGPSVPVLQQLLEEGWEPVRETPMGGGTSQLAHSLILLERDAPKSRSMRSPKPR